MNLEPEEEYKYKLPRLGENSNLFHKINCPACSTEIPASGLHISDKIGTCASCNAVFSIEKEIAKIKSERSPRQEMIRPEGIDLFYFQDEMDITLQQPMPVLPTIATVFMPMVALIFIGIYSEEGFPILFFFSAVSMLAFVWSLVHLIRRKRHKIHFNIDDRQLNIQWRPKILVKDRRYAVEDIDQVYVKEANTHYYLYLMINGTEGQKHEKVLSLGTSLTKAKYLEQEIEYFLGIENRKVFGEEV